MTTTN